MFSNIAHKYHFFFIFASETPVNDMKIAFQNITSTAFDGRFPDDEACLAYLSAEKWDNGFVCRKCGHQHYCKGKKPFSRRCTRCKTEESATAHTPFHRCRISLREAFRIGWYCCNTPGITSGSISEALGIRQMTCWKFKKKLMQYAEGLEGGGFVSENTPQGCPEQESNLHDRSVTTP